MYAIIVTGGKQYRVEQGDIVMEISSFVLFICLSRSACFCSSSLILSLAEDIFFLLFFIA